MRDVVRVAPETFDRDLLEVLEEELDKKYANKMIPDVGLSICVNDFQTIEDAIIYPGDGGAYHKVVFRLFVFRPFVGEIAVGTIIHSDEKGIRVSLDFFDDIFIPNYLLPQPSEYDQRAKLWVWKYEGSEEGGIFTLHEQIRFRIESIGFTQIETTMSGRQATMNSTENSSSSKNGETSSYFNGVDMRGVHGLGKQVIEGQQVRQRSTSIDLSKEVSTATDPPCMQITASVNDHGLGLVCWNWE